MGKRNRHLCVQKPRRFLDETIIKYFLTKSTIFSTKELLAVLALKLVHTALFFSLCFIQFNHAVNHVAIRLNRCATTIMNAIITLCHAPSQ